MIYKIIPVAGCKDCHGTGEVADWVDYGSTTVPMYSTCWCVDDQLPEEFDCMHDEIELVSELEND